MESLKIGTININGGREKNKRAVLSKYIQTKNINIAFIQETHSDQINEIDWRMWWDGNIFFSHGTNFWKKYKHNCYVYV